MKLAGPDLTSVMMHPFGWPLFNVPYTKISVVSDLSSGLAAMMLVSLVEKVN
jgi:hypothetical protein